MSRGLARFGKGGNGELVEAFQSGERLVIKQVLLAMLNWSKPSVCRCKFVYMCTGSIEFIHVQALYHGVFVHSTYILTISLPTSIAPPQTLLRESEWSIVTQMDHPNVMPWLALICGDRSDTKPGQIVSYQVMPKMTGGCGEWLDRTRKG